MSTREEPNRNPAEWRGKDMSYAIRVALFYAALFLVYGIHVPYFPVWLDWRGLTENEVAAITAAPFLLRLFITPACAAFADRIANPRAVIIALSWVGLAAALFLSQASGFWPLFLLGVPFAVAVATIMPLTETVAVQGVRASGLDYGRMRLWGSLSFIAMGLAAGSLIDLHGAGISITLLLFACAATIVAAYLLPPSPVRSGADTSAKFAGLFGPNLRILFASPVFVAFLLAASCTQAAHALFYTFGALHLKTQGISGFWVGTLWAIGVLSEVVLFAFSGGVLRYLRPQTLLLIAALAAIVRWGVMSFDPPLSVLLPLQVLHAATYGAAHLGAIHYITAQIPEDMQATAQGLYATFAAGVVMGAATLASGALYRTYEGDAYLAMALLAAVSLAASLFILHRRG
jgi:MFS transporter, PPP family, 3-phenylpropionic acid transporter